MFGSTNQHIIEAENVSSNDIYINETEENDDLNFIDEFFCATPKYEPKRKEFGIIRDGTAVSKSNGDNTEISSKLPLFSKPHYTEADVLTAKQLLRVSIKQVFLITLTAIPVFVVVTLVGYGYSRLHWTRKPLPDLPQNSYFNRKTMFWFDDVMRTVLIASLNVIVGGVLYDRSIPQSLFYVLMIALPLSLFGGIAFYFLYSFTTPYFIWFYYVDIVIFMLVFFFVVAITQLFLCRRANITSSQALIKYILPMYAMAIGTCFVDIYFSKTYRVEKNGSLLKYAQRLVVYPIIMDSFLGFGEFFVRKLDGTSVQGQAHSLYLIQVRFGILARYMNISVGSLSQLTITCTVVAIKDIMFHRMGRVQCWLFFIFRRCITKRQSSTEEFRSWYFKERFREFRACVLNNDLLHEFTATMVTPLLLYFFQRHRLLFRFDENLVVESDNKLDVKLFIYQLLIQLVFLFMTYIVIIFIEGRYNGVDLRVAFARRNLLQEISQVVIYVWGMLQILSAVRVVPNYFQCESENICTCKFNLNKTLYGCIHPEPIHLY